MRTTVDISEAHRVRLIEVAGERGAKGFSSILAEAIDAYLLDQSREERKKRGAAALDAFLRISPETGAEIAANLEEARRTWTR